MTIDPDLLAILACPCEHHAPLAEVAAGDADGGADAAAGGPSLECTRCRTHFPIREGIPVLLLDEATPGPSGIGADRP